ncbi:MAG: hypothetical protein LXA50_17700 [Betaproteobacteria bacterium]|nr:hypothetical protein [Betaproteobacteria bacterium]
MVTVAPGELNTGSVLTPASASTGRDNGNWASTMASQPEISRAFAETSASNAPSTT